MSVSDPGVGVPPRRGRRVLVVMVLLLGALSAVGLLTYRPDTGDPGVLATPSPPPKALVTVFIGDGYTQGAGATTDANRWSTLVSASKDWEEVNLGLGGTGYVSTSGINACGDDFCASYREVIGDLANLYPDIVVIAGGQNDFAEFEKDPERVRKAIRETFARAQELAPEAEIIGVGPAQAEQPDSVARSFEDTVKKASHKVNGSFVSLMEPRPVLTSAMVSSNGRLSDAGHRAIADRVLADLRG